MRIACAAIASCLLFTWSAWAQPPVPTSSRVTLSDGTMLGPGVLTQIGTISKNSMQLGQSETTSLSIYKMDDELRYTYFNQARLRSATPETVKEEEIVLPVASEAQVGAGAFAIRQVLRVQQFNKHGRRIYTILGLRGPEDMLQGITHITPTYARVQTLKEKGVGFRPWDQRIGTTTIPPETLRTILHHELNMNSPEDRMRLYRFYVQAKRYPEARQELLDALEKFPDQLADQRGLLFNLNNAVINQMFEEVALRRESGQFKFVSQYLELFIKSHDSANDATEPLLKAQGEIDRIREDVKRNAETIAQIKQIWRCCPLPIKRSLLPSFKRWSKRSLSSPLAWPTTRLARGQSKHRTNASRMVSVVGCWGRAVVLRTLRSLNRPYA